MATQGLVKELIKIAGQKNVLSSRRDLLAYSYDATQHQEIPEAVVFPPDAAAVSKVIRLAGRYKVPVIPRGAGTGISGGTVPVKGGVILELSRMNAILTVDTANRRAVVEPGVVNLDLQEALAPSGFMYPPDPASQKSCTLGGNIGENAGGPLCFKYGVTSKYVCGMEVVLPDGEIVELGGSVEDPPGYDLRGLLIGSEGTLGIATRLTLHILPLPEASKTMLAVFDTLDKAGQAVSDIIAAGIVPAALELMDKKMCGVIEQGLHAGYPVDAEGVLLIEITGLEGTLDRQVKAISEICLKNGVRELRAAKTAAEKDALWKGRKGAFGSVARICPPYLVNDGTVPRNKMVPALLKVQELTVKYKVQIATVAHAGDGNLHPLILFDKNNQEEARAARKTAEEILDTCLALGGTISGEHGIGLEKLAAMTRQFSGADLAVMRRIKQVFDPGGILNPDKLLPGTGETPPVDSCASTVSGPRSFFHELENIAGPDNLLTGSSVEPAYRVDGLNPEAVVKVSTTEQAARIIRAANRFKKAVVPWGHGTKQGLGRCLSACDVILDLREMDRIEDFDQGNSTVRTGAGKSLSDLQRQMAEYKLLFPADPIFSTGATIGGTLAAGASGPHRLMYGAVRDLVLGLTVVTPTGDIIHPGGKTMKNVAGLDLVKLYIGSLGTLGIITEAVLRLCPIPEVSLNCGLVLPGIEPAREMVSRIMNSKLTPGSLELVDREAGRCMEIGFIPGLEKDEVLLMIDLEGSSETVERHRKDILGLAGALGVTKKYFIEDGWSGTVRKAGDRLHFSFFNKYPAAVKARVSVPLSGLAAMYQAAKETGDRYGLKIGIQAHAGSGILYLYIPPAAEADAGILESLNQAAVSLGGFLTLEKAPPEIRKTFGARPPGGAFSLMEKLKTALDPENILNPGKVVGGQC